MPDSYPHLTNGGDYSSLKRMNIVEASDLFATHREQGPLIRRLHHFTLLHAGKNQAFMRGVSRYDKHSFYHPL